MESITVAKKVEDLVAGNLVDLESCPFLNKHPSAASEFGYVNAVTRETPECVVIAYEGIDSIGYPLGTELQVRVPKDVPDPVVRVQLPAEDGKSDDWHISQNLTDRDGELNYYNEENKPLELLISDQARLDRLIGQMWGGATFVVRKDAEFGILFEAEYCSRESEESDRGVLGEEEYAKLKPHAEVVAALLAGMKPLVEKFPLRCTGLRGHHQRPTGCVGICS